jgi:prevent-host-death family protein
MKPSIEQCSIEDFKAHVERYLQHARRSQVPLFVTDSTEGAVVVLTVASFVALQQQGVPRHDVVRQVTVLGLTH